jgi:cytochrome P450
MTMLDLYVSHSFHLKELVKNAVRCRMGWSISMAMMPHGLWWRKHRKSFHEYFHRDAVTKYQPIQRQEVRAFLRRLLVTPDNFFHHIRQ